MLIELIRTLAPVFMILGIDSLSFLGLREVLGASRLRRWVVVSYWTLAIVMIFLVATRRMAPELLGGSVTTARLLLLLLLYVPKLVFLAFMALDAGIRLGMWFFAQVTIGGRFPWPKPTWLAGVGGIAASTLFLALTYGLLFARDRVVRRDVPVTVAALPEGLDGLTIALVSDLHVSEPRSARLNLERMVDMVNGADADLVLLAGDVGTADELGSIPPFLHRMKARLGKFAVLGNHDFGRKERASSNWVDAADKEAKIQHLKELYLKGGFRLLFNEATRMERGGRAFSVLGTGPFDPHHGFDDAKVSQAMEGQENTPLNILLTHNPELWFKEVAGRQPIALTLAGHTHGGQVGFEVGPVRLSAGDFMFRHWAGLLTSKDQALYVNRGWGVFGFPFRVGIPAEVTILRLKRPSVS